MFKKIIYWFIIGIALIQFIPVDRTNKPVIAKNNFANIVKPPKEVQEILKNSCYDCHSDETKYPDYAFVAPISWSIKHHINEGREHLNFSEWGTFNKDLKQNMLENSAGDFKQYRMPMPGYIAYHHKANISNVQRNLVADYFDSLLKSGKY